MFDKITRSWSKSQQLGGRLAASRTLSSTSMGQAVTRGSPWGDRPFTPGLGGAAPDQMQGAGGPWAIPEAPWKRPNGKAKLRVRRLGARSGPNPEGKPWGAPRPLFGGGPGAEMS